MKTVKLILATALITMLALGLSASPSPAASDFPQKDITLIVPWAAGGGTDLVARQIAALMEKETGKTVVVINKPGGGGLIGFQTLAAAKPDGYTLGLTTNSMLLQKYASVNFLDYKALNHFIMVNEDPAALTVPANAPWKSVGEFVAAAKEKPGTLRVSNSGPGAIWHASAMMFEKVAGIKIVHVPYDGANPAGVAAAGGHVEATFVSPGEVSSLVAAGKLRTIAITGDQRLANFPNLPTFKEEGVDLVTGVWRAIAAPAKTPPAVIAKLEEIIKKCIETQQYQDFLKNANLGYRYMDSKAMAGYLAKQDADYAVIFKDNAATKK